MGIAHCLNMSCKRIREVQDDSSFSLKRLRVELTLMEIKSVGGLGWVGVGEKGGKERIFPPGVQALILIYKVNLA